MHNSSSKKNLYLFIKYNELSFFTKTTQNSDVFFSDITTVNTLTDNNVNDVKNLETIFNSNLTLLLHYDTIEIYTLTEPFSITPKNYDVKNSFVNFSNFNENTIVEDFDFLDVNFVYNIPEAYSILFNKLANYKNAKYNHIAKSIIKEAINNRENSDVHMRLFNKNLELCITKDNQLVLYNIFNILGEEDIIYHLLNTCQQLNLDLDNLILTVLGGVKKDDLIANMLQKYFTNINFSYNINEVNLLYNLIE